MTWLGIDSACLAAWMVMMLVVMALAGAGIFVMNIGIMAPIVTMMLHLIFGAVLGFAYSKSVTANSVAV